MILTTSANCESHYSDNSGFLSQYKNSLTTFFEIINNHRRKVPSNIYYNWIETPIKNLVNKTALLSDSFNNNYHRKKKRIFKDAKKISLYKNNLKSIYKITKKHRRKSDSKIYHNWIERPIKILINKLWSSEFFHILKATLRKNILRRKRRRKYNSFISLFKNGLRRQIGVLDPSIGRSILTGVANIGITYAGFANSIINNEFREEGLAAIEKDLDDLEDMVTGLEAVATSYQSTLSSACTFASYAVDNLSQYSSSSFSTSSQTLWSNYPSVC